MQYSNIPLKLKSWGSYFVTKKGIFLYMERGFSVFIPKKTFLNILYNMGDIPQMEAKK